MGLRCFSLERYAGVRSRHTCPACGGRRCFTLYVDESGEPLSEVVGRCDHESSCGYHYRPRDYFREHPEAAGRDWREASEGLLRRLSVYRGGKRPLCVIPFDMVSRSVRIDIGSSFTVFLRRLFDEETVVGLVRDYWLGVTRAGDVIFFQIDKRGWCRTGKIMRYDAVSGHRVKDEGVKGRITWVHSLLKVRRALPEDWVLSQCLFGEHLLARFPDKAVALVESEKTAVICAGVMPDYIWLATGGKSQFNERLDVLSGREVVAFPDVDGFDEWMRKAAALPYLNIKVSRLLRDNATAKEREEHIDIADWLVKWMLEPGAKCSSRSEIVFREVEGLVCPEYRDEVRALIEDLGLEVWSEDVLDGEVCLMDVLEQEEKTVLL